ncbi:tetratricopeptide repeat protein [Helicobacter equorum]|uniref:tetratricopeptide repeat protein n=1 Tax=Helicobacter equorum TaxID=361872 RepID=UPI000CF14C1B|nr:tetratricopeptide repeat protein [Helicobacter equorum]
MSSIKTITLATIYENQGLKEDALKIYQDILELQPDNQEARLGVIRLSTNSTNTLADPQWLEVFAQFSNPTQNKKFQEWLLQWN